MPAEHTQQINKWINRVIDTTNYISDSLSTKCTVQASTPSSWFFTICVHRRWENFCYDHNQRHCTPGTEYLKAILYSISQEICTRFLLCCGYTLTAFPIFIRLTSLALWQSNDCPSASKSTLMNMDKYFMWIHYERLHNHNKAKHNKTVCIFLGIYCMLPMCTPYTAQYRWQ